MDILVVGGGGREHAIIKKLRKSPGVDKIYALPGNGGMLADARCVPIGATEIEKIRDFAVDSGVGYAVVSPDDPLAMGAVDALNAAGIAAFGPNAAAARIEASKAFSKKLMKKYKIPTASFEIFESYGEAFEYIKKAKFPLVIKADGLALGKGVVVASGIEEAKAALTSMMKEKKFGKSGERVVIEEFLQGPEVSVLSFTDGKTLIPMVSSMDHKRAFDGDLGPNTGGMGAVAPNPFYTKEVARRSMEEIFLPTAEAMRAEGRPFKGCLYFGLMITEDGPKVIEYNCRFGDPEAQAVLPLLEGDLFEIMRACTFGRLSDVKFGFSSEHSCCVVSAAGGYPVKYEKGNEISISGDALPYIYAAGVKMSEDGKPVTAGGRVLGVSAKGDTLYEAVSKAYKINEGISFKDRFYRKDIGKRALLAYKER